MDSARILKALAKNGYLREIQTTKPFTYEILREKPKHLSSGKMQGENCLFWLESLEKLVISTFATLQQRGVQYKIEGLDEWVKRVQSKLNGNNAAVSVDKNGGRLFSLV